MLNKSPISLVACEFSASDVQLAAQAAERLGLHLFTATKADDCLDGFLDAGQCIVLANAEHWADDELADLASRLALGNYDHGGIVLCGHAMGPVRQHLVSARLMRAVNAPLELSELIAVLAACVQRVRRSSMQANVPPRQAVSSIHGRSRKGEFEDLRELVRGITARRRAREGIFPEGLFSDPAWDILLSLAHARIEKRSTQVSNIGIEADIPPSTALRRVKDLEIAGLVTRWGDPNDRRREFVQLSDAGLNTFIKYAERVLTSASDIL